MLIDETEATFRIGQIVTAQVTRLFEGKENSDKGGLFLCKLDNGLDARVEAKDLNIKVHGNNQDVIQPGHVLTGRIH